MAFIILIYLYNTSMIFLNTANQYSKSERFSRIRNKLIHLSDTIAFIILFPDFQKWRFFFCDERVVPFDHPESTFGAFRSLITSVPGLSEAFFVPINPVLPLEDCERDYTLRLCSVYIICFA